MTCEKVRARLPGYLDGALRAREHAPLSQHLESCGECRAEMEQYRRLSALMSRTQQAAPPADLALRVRVAVAEARAARGWGERLWGRARLILENVLEPLALPATGGFVAALAVLAVFIQLFVVGLPLGTVPNDLPTNFLQPARLESLAPFPVPGPLPRDDNEIAGPHSLLIEATVNAQGELVNYQIIDGPRDLAVRRQLDQVLMFSRFRPQMSFGRPTHGGRVVLSFSEIRVKG